MMQKCKGSYEKSSLPEVGIVTNVKYTFLDFRSFYPLCLVKCNTYIHRETLECEEERFV